MYILYMYIIHVHLIHVHYTCTLYMYIIHVHVHDVIGDVERKKERHLRQWKNENESCLRWDSNP